MTNTNLLILFLTDFFRNFNKMRAPDYISFKYRKGNCITPENMKELRE